MYSNMLRLVPQTSQVFWKELLILFPEINQLGTIQQDKIYHGEGDVLTHTKMVCDELIQLEEYKKADLNKKFILFYAAFLHDIAKYSCTEFNGSTWISPGHSKRGAVDARYKLWEFGVPFHIREEICNVIATHQVPFFFFTKKDNLDYALFKLSHEVVISSLYPVAKADMLGRFYAQKQKCLDDIELFRELAIEKNCYNSGKVFPDDDTKMKYFWTKGGISADYPFYREKGSTVTVLSGMPASGKDTFAKKHYPHLLQVSYDQAREVLGLDYTDNFGAAIQLSYAKAKSFLAKKIDFVWNATHLSAQMREKTLDIIYQYGGRAEIVYLEAPIEIIKQRNSERNSTITNEKIIKMLYHWEVPHSTEAHSLKAHLTHNENKHGFKPKN